MEYGAALRAAIPAGGIGERLYVYATLGSTNSRAAELARMGAPEGTLVVADQQTAGRGRRGATWHTPAGEAIAMSLILRPPSTGLRWTGLGAVAVVQGLASQGVQTWVKWPNDVLLNGRKVAGVLAEAAWEGGALASIVLGIGINVGRRSAPGDDQVDYPATSLEAAIGARIDRPGIVAAVITAIDKLQRQVETQAFVGVWEGLLAFRDERVRVETSGGPMDGILRGLGPDGEAVLEDVSGFTTRAGADAWGLRPLGDGGTVSSP
jgi:BirA family biotin operon repressor/biotin-[acetyl-CoA-carboxylase] ligase